MQQQNSVAQSKQTVAAKEDDAQRWQQRLSPQTGQRSQSTSCENPLPLSSAKGRQVLCPTVDCQAVCLRYQSGVSAVDRRPCRRSWLG